MPVAKLEEVDRYILARYGDVARKILHDYEEYEYGPISQALTQFVTVDLSSLYNDISTGQVKPSEVTVVEAHFRLDAEDVALLPPGYESCIYRRGRKLDNTAWHDIAGAPATTKGVRVRRA